MFYKVQLDLYSDMEDQENPEFFIKKDELVSFMDVCFRSQFSVIVTRISEDEFNNSITSE